MNDIEDFNLDDIEEALADDNVIESDDEYDDEAGSLTPPKLPLTSDDEFDEFDLSDNDESLIEISEDDSGQCAFITSCMHTCQMYARLANKLSNASHYYSSVIHAYSFTA